VTRRPKSRLPPKLPDPIRERTPAVGRDPSRRDRLKHGRVAGRSTEFGSNEINGVMRRVARNDGGALLGCAPFDGVTFDHVHAAVEAVYGWAGDGPRARIAVDRTIDGFTAAAARVREVALGGGRLAFATECPASLFTIHRALANDAVAAGGDVFDAIESSPIDDRGARATRLRWIDRVAMFTDGVGLMPVHAPTRFAAQVRSRRAAAELLFCIGHPDLVVADRTFAGAALASGIEVVALAGIDAVALAVAAWRGLAIRVVPLDEHRAPSAYAPLLELLEPVPPGP
jgi:hypothetical protein